MKRRIIAGALAVAVAGSLSTAAIAFADDHGKQSTHHAKAAQTENADRDDSAEDTGEDDGDGAGGPPPWAHGAGVDKAWKVAWHKLTPSQREARMSRLAHEHATGMKKWTACVQKAGTGTSARAKCVRPLPPGLAKKKLGN